MAPDMSPASATSGMLDIRRTADPGMISTVSSSSNVLSPSRSARETPQSSGCTGRPLVVQCGACCNTCPRSRASRPRPPGSMSCLPSRCLAHPVPTPRMAAHRGSVRQASPRPAWLTSAMAATTPAGRLRHHDHRRSTCTTHKLHQLGGSDTRPTRRSHPRRSRHPCSGPPVPIIGWILSSTIRRLTHLKPLTVEREVPSRDPRSAGRSRAPSDGPRGRKRR